MGLRHPVLVMRAYIHVISNTHTQMQSRSRPHAHMHVHPPTFTHMSRYGEEQVKCELAPTRSIMEMRAGSSCVPRLHSCFAWRSSSFVLYYTTIPRLHSCFAWRSSSFVLYYENKSASEVHTSTSFLVICIVWRSSSFVLYYTLLKLTCAGKWERKGHETYLNVLVFCLCVSTSCSACARVRGPVHECERACIHIHKCIGT